MSTADIAEVYDEWLTDFPLRGMALFGALPEVFTFDELMMAADHLEIPSLEAVEHIRIMEREQIICIVKGRFEKTGITPNP
jgi:hypothetical protein